MEKLTGSDRFKKVLENHNKQKVREEEYQSWLASNEFRMFVAAVSALMAVLIASNYHDQIMGFMAWIDPFQSPGDGPGH